MDGGKKNSIQTWDRQNWSCHLDWTYTYCKSNSPQKKGKDVDWHIDCQVDNASTKTTA